MNPTPLDAALFYATEKVWPVFPLLPRDKHPLFKSAHEAGNTCHGECGKVGHGFHDATIDADKIRAWWGEYPTAGVGIATGKKSGFWALDVDTAHGGESTLAALLEQRGTLPETVIQQTGGGGRHILFSYPPVDIGNSAGKLGAGLDTRGTGGYICAAPTIHPSGRAYRWINPPSKTLLAGAPDWMLHALLDNKPAPMATGTPTNGAFITGQRNSSLTSQAGAMRRKGMSEDAIFMALQAENLARCVPPLTESEVRAIVSSVMRYDPTAAPQLTNKDRLLAEWAFCTCLYLYPDDLVDYPEMVAGLFSEQRLAKFMERLQSGAPAVTAAADAGLLDEFAKYNEYLVPRMPDYAAAIRSFAHYEQVAALGGQLHRAALNSDAERVDRLLMDINKTVDVSRNDTVSISEVSDQVDAEIEARVANPAPVWGIPYAWPRLSELTGGKQPGELILLAGEPKVGKSWWALQDAMHAAVYESTPVMYWSGEMRRQQVVRRLYQLLGVNGRNMRSGSMTAADWESLRDAKALLLNSPLYIDDQPLQLANLRAILKQRKVKYGLRQVVLDYAYLIGAPGKDENERTGLVSREVKLISSELDLSIVLIASVSKVGMDTTNDNVAKSNVRGSGQQIHDADIIYMLTHFAKAESDSVALKYKPAEYERLVTLHITAGRELDESLPGGRLHFSRLGGSPFLTEEVQEHYTAKVIRNPKQEEIKPWTDQ